MKKLSKIMPFFVCVIILALFLCFGILGMASMFPVAFDNDRHANVYDLEDEEAGKHIIIQGEEWHIGNPSMIEGVCPDWEDMEFLWQLP